MESGSWTFLSLKAGEAILDIGATQDLIGRAAVQQLTRELGQQGLRPVTVDVPVPSPSGIGRRGQGAEGDVGADCAGRGPLESCR